MTNMLDFFCYDRGVEGGGGGLDWLCSYTVRGS